MVSRPQKARYDVLIYFYFDTPYYIYEKTIIHSRNGMSIGKLRRYERPELSVAADSLYRTEVKADTASSVADLSWKELFTDPYLQALIQQALEMNTDLRIAYLKVKEMQVQLVSAKLAYLPSVQLDPQGTLSSLDGSKTSKTYEVGASAS